MVFEAETVSNVFVDAVTVSATAHMRAVVVGQLSVTAAVSLPGARSTSHDSLLPFTKLLKSPS